MLVNLLIGILVVGILVFAVVSVAGSKSVLALREATVTPMPDDVASTYFLPPRAGGVADPLTVENLGFQPVGAYKMTGGAGPTVIVAWRKPEEDTFLCIYQVTVQETTQEATDYVTLSQEGGMLTTGSNKGGQLLPSSKRGHYLQTFETFSLSELWKKHEAGLATLKKSTGFVPRHPAGKLHEIIAESIHQQVAAVEQIPLWKLKLPFWFFIRQNVRHNKSIKKLYGDLA
ncbi:MAG: hypothetical protein RH917_05710 [Lacipirellulaceae bacterium]